MDGARVPSYNPEDESRDPRTMDLSEIQDELERINETLAERKAVLDKEQTDKQAAQFEARYQAEKAAKEAAQSNNVP